MKAVVLVSHDNDPKDELRQGLSAAFGELEVIRATTKQQALDEIPSAELLYAFAPSIEPPLLKAAAQLRWIQLLGSGLDAIVEISADRPDVLITNGRGAQAEPVSEAVIAFMFALARDIPRLVANQKQRLWARRPAQLLKSSVVGIVGVGAIAERLAVKCKALGMRVFGVSSAPRAVAGFECILPMSDLPQLASEADWLVILTPLSDRTRGLVGSQVLSGMRPSSYLINVARGGVVNEPALVDALRARHIAGAALDVFAEEPLPSSSPLWDCPNTLVSPHLGGLNTRYMQELLPLLVENTRLFLDGDIAGMANRVER